MQNELDIAVSYEGCEFLPTEGSGKGGAQFAGYDRALAAVADRLNALGKDSPRILGPETFTIKTDSDGRSHVQKYVDPTTEAGRSSLSRLFGVSFHIYGSGAESPDPAQFHRFLADIRETYLPDWKGKPLFQTEFIHGPSLTALAGQIHDCFTIGEVSAYFVWILARGLHQPGFALVYYNTQDGSVERRERFYAVKHFSAFVGEGWTRVESVFDDPEVKVSAYVGPGRQLSVVLINPTKAERRVALQPDGGYAAATVYRSTEGEDGEKWRELGALPADRTVELPPRSVATVHYTR